MNGHELLGGPPGPPHLGLRRSAARDAAPDLRVCSGAAPWAVREKGLQQVAVSPPPGADALEGFLPLGCTSGPACTPLGGSASAWVQVQALPFIRYVAFEQVPYRLCFNFAIS